MFLILFRKYQRIANYHVKTTNQSKQFRLHLDLKKEENDVLEQNTNWIDILFGFVLIFCSGVLHFDLSLVDELW